MSEVAEWRGGITKQRRWTGASGRQREGGKGDSFRGTKGGKTCAVAYLRCQVRMLTTGAGRYANRRVYRCGTRLLFLHLLFIYLQGDSLHTKAGDQELLSFSASPPPPLSVSQFLFFSPSYSFLNSKERSGERDGSTASA